MQFRLGGGLAIALVLAGCSDNTAPGGGLGSANVRLVNTVASSPGLDLVVGGEVRATGVTSAEASPYVEVPAGTQTIALRSGGSATQLAALTTNLLAGSRYTVMASGAGATITPRVVVDTGNFDPEKANLRIINVPEIRTGPDSSSARPPTPIDVYITEPEGSLAAVEPTLSLDQNQHSYSALIYFAPGTWRVRFTAGGTKTVLADSDGIPIAAGQARAVTLYRTEDLGYAVRVTPE